jgi:predicted kinase
MEAVIFVGIQAAGKSTFYCERFFRSHVRISLDLLRTRHRERSLLAWCLGNGQRFVVDNTNVTEAERAASISPARAAGFHVVGYVFEANVPASITRNAGRAEAEQVPAKAISGTKKRLEWPRLDEGFDELHYVRVNPAGGFLLEEWRDAIT